VSGNLPAFRLSMCCLGLRESRSFKVKLDAVSPEGLSVVLSFLYGAQFDLEPDNCIEVLALSDLYDLTDLKVLCELYLVHHLEAQLEDPENAQEAFQQIGEAATLYNAPRLAARLEELQARRQRSSAEAHTPTETNGEDQL
jgi:hypothetical protein